MATITKTFTENERTSNKSTWTLSVTGKDQKVAGHEGEPLGDIFGLLLPTVKMKYVGTGKGYATINSKLRLSVGGYNTDESIEVYFGRPYATVDADDYVKTASNTYYTMETEDLSSGYDFDLTKYFNSTNPTWRTRNVYARLVGWTDFQSSNKAEDPGEAHGARWNGYINEDASINLGIIGTVTLDAPPVVTLGTPTYAAPHYTTLGEYNVPITQLKAQFGGNITSVKLAVGDKETTQTYSSNTVSNKTISVIPTKAGTFTPVLTVTDSRGQTKTKSLTPITVSQYVAPSVNFGVYRTDQHGVKSDEGAYGLITATINFTDAIASITPTITINGETTNNVTWYSGYSSSTGVSDAISDWSSVGSGETIYGLINGSFSTTQSYAIGMTITDSINHTSPAVMQKLSTAFYTIDVQAGGREIAFGMPANDDLTDYPDGLFKCAMEPLLIRPRETGDTMWRAKRTDTDTGVGFGIGAGGINHGVWSSTQNRWLLFGDTENVYLAGTYQSSVLKIGDDGVTVGGHGSPIGYVKSVTGDSSTPDVTASANSTVNIGSISLGAGTWIVVCTARFSPNANGNNYTGVILSPTSQDSGWTDRRFGQGTYQIQHSFATVVQPTSTTTYYLCGSTVTAGKWNRANGNQYSIRAVRIA